MSDERPPPDEWLTEDPFANPEDPAALERAERRAEREQKRRKKAAKEAGEPPPSAPEPPPAEAPKPKRTPEQEFWDEDPTPPPTAEPASPPGPQADTPGSEPEPESSRAEAEQAAQANTRPAGNAGRAKRFGRRRRASEAPPPVVPPPSGSESAEPPTEQRSVPSGAEPRPGSPAGQEANEPGLKSNAEQSTPAPRAEPSAADPAPPTELQPLPPAPPAEDRAGQSPASPAGDRPAQPPTQDPVPNHPTEDPVREPPTQDPVLEPVPVGADPTRPATGEHLVPDPQAPHVRGQTSEEWAAVPAARASALDDELHEEGDPTMAGAARSGRRRGDGGGNRRGGFVGALARHPFRIAAVVILIVVLWFLNGLFEPFHGDGHGRVVVQIPKGASVSEVGDILEKRGVIGGPGLIDASTLFQIRATLAGKRSDLHHGRFVLQKDMSYSDAIDALSGEAKAAPKPGIAEVLVPPALSRSQVAQLMKEDGIRGNYMKASVKSNILSPAEYGGKQATSLEGFLFPDTYEVRTKEGVEGVVSRQLEAFKQNVKKVNMKYAKSKNLNVYDVVTIASMIEGEAAVEKERKLVASVIYNRLHEGMPLQIDATVRFATGNHQRPLSESELASDSPYNTYVNSGLPAGPINSPGLESMQAAAHPARTNYLFYVVDPRGCNEHDFSATEEEFLADVDRYEKAREANGGNAPSSC